MFAQSSDSTQPPPPPLAAVQSSPPQRPPSHFAPPPVTVSATPAAPEAPRLSAVAVVASEAATAVPVPSLAPGTRAAIAANAGTVSSLSSYVPLNVTQPPHPPSVSASDAAAPAAAPQTPAVSNGANTIGPATTHPGAWDSHTASVGVAPKHPAPDAATPLAAVGTSDETVGSVAHVNQGSGVTTPTAALTPTQRATSSAMATPAGVPAAFSANVTGQRMRPDQSQVLKDFFNSNRTPSKEEVRGLAERIGESEKKIKTWFTNQRAKEKRLTLTNPGAAPTSAASSPALFGPSHPPGWSPAPQASLKSEDDGSTHARMAVDESSDLLHAATSPPSSELHDAHAQPQPATPMALHAPGHETERSSPPHDHSGPLVAATRDPDSTDGERVTDRTGSAVAARQAHAAPTKKSGHGKGSAGATTVGVAAAAQASHIVPIKAPDAFTADMLPPEAVVNVQFLMASRYFKPLGYIFSSSSASSAAAGQLSGATAGPTSSAAAAGADRKKRRWETDAATRPASPAGAADGAKRRRLRAEQNGQGSGLAAPGQKPPAAALSGGAAAPVGRAGDPARARSTSGSSSSGSESGSSSSGGSDSGSGSGSESESESGSSSGSSSGSVSGSSSGSSSDGSGSESKGEGEGGGRTAARPGEALVARVSSRASQASSQSDQLDHLGSIVK
ncbi:hypothetical protein HK405_006528 [Cladochytrium tenue]|nr:hypothetical protein HK405_006528 [Cladochytrium tenue]